MEKFVISFPATDESSSEFKREGIIRSIESFFQKRPHVRELAHGSWMVSGRYRLENLRFALNLSASAGIDCTVVCMDEEK